MKFVDKKKQKFIHRVGKENDLFFSPCAMAFLKDLQDEEIKRLLGNFSSHTKVTKELLLKVDSDMTRKSFKEFTVLDYSYDGKENGNKYISRYECVKERCRKSKLLQNYRLSLFVGENKFETFNARKPTHILTANLGKTASPLVEGSFFLVDRVKNVINVPFKPRDRKPLRVSGDSGFKVLLVGGLYLDHLTSLPRLESIFDECSEKNIKLVVLFGPLLTVNASISLKEALRVVMKGVGRYFPSVKKVLVVPSRKDPVLSSSNFVPLFPISKAYSPSDTSNKLQFCMNPCRLQVHDLFDETSSIMLFNGEYKHREVGKGKDVAKLITHNGHLYPFLGARMLRNFDKCLYLDDEKKNFFTGMVVLNDDTMGPYSLEYKKIGFMNVPSLKTGKYAILDAANNDVKFYTS